jgi:hypothetical protein
MPASCDLCETIGLLLGPVLALKQRDELPAWRRAQDAARAGAVVLFGPRHPGTKLIALVALLAVVLLSVVDTSRTASPPRW